MAKTAHRFPAELEFKLLPTIIALKLDAGDRIALHHHAPSRHPGGITLTALQRIGQPAQFAAMNALCE